MPTPLEALANAAILKNSSAGSNFGQYEDLFDIGVGGNAQDDAFGRGVAEDVAGAFGAPSSIRALMDRAEAESNLRRQGMVDNIADLESGLPGRQMELEGDLANRRRDLAAQGEFYPYTEQLHERSAGEAQDLANLRYTLPAQIKAGADLQSANIAAQGRVDAARAGHTNPALKALQDAIRQYFVRYGEMPTPEQMANLKQTYGIQ